MNTINPNVFLGIFAVIAASGLLILASGQSVYGQESTAATKELETSIASITGLVTTLAALAGTILVAYAKMSQKLGTATDGEIKKMLLIANELHDSDNWSKELEKDLLALGEVVKALPGGEKMLEEKRVDLKRWGDSVAKLDTEISGIYKNLLPLLLVKK